MSKVRTALVIGGGIAGPVAATALHKAGIEATVHEAYPAESDGIGGALGLAPNGLAALGVIGADEAVRAIADPMRRMVMSFGGRPQVLPGLPDVTPLHMVARGDLHRVLRERAVAAGVRFAYGKRLVAAEDGPDGVTARFADGTSARADVLIGADGIRSTVRSLIDPDAPGPDYTGLLGLGGLADVDLDVAPGTTTFAYGKRAYYLYWPQPGGGTAWGANLPSRTYLTLTQAREIPAEEWLRRLRETYADDVPGGELAGRTTPESLQIVGGLHIMPPVPHWYRGRMVLVGDAVHAPSNSTGQGASLAIESAIELARCLRDLPDPSSAFAAYERLRRTRVEKIAARGAKVNHTKAPGPVARRIIPVLMPLAFKVMNVEKSLSWEQRHTIDWDTPATMVEHPSTAPAGTAGP
ncbi:FAD-dependent oxidoreductase [Actinoallomurus rhizosphaericola]|uniref:FAD-dependent oxidoreductase n=1 Tax=Actinoallomurus rhizosphaericola TaxID=2952536 RepID=UPI0020922154|nr:NAD(P)/FAD-dependent oxidoreductase [Actinoallomurus rhizosphaericola]MCO5997681.1 FAD-dependent monooxygenase [Actinoallomurus rhizosphaericola]